MEFLGIVFGLDFFIVKPFFVGFVVLTDFFQRKGALVLNEFFQTGYQAAEGTIDGVGGGCEEFAENERHQLTLTVGQSVERGPGQIVGHHVVEFLLIFRGEEFLQDGDALGVLYVLQHLAAEGTLADGLQAATEIGVIFLFQIVAELGLEALEVAKYIVIDDGYQTVEFQDGVLERRRCEEDFLAVREGLFDGVGGFVGGLIDVAQPVSFVDDGEVPLGVADVRRFGFGELVGADDDFVSVKGVEVAGFDGCVETLGLQDDGREEEFLQQFTGPLLPEVGRSNDQEAAFMLGPVL